MPHRILAGFALLVAISGCADEELAPIITFTDLEVGAFPRLLSLSDDEYDIENLDATAISYSVELDDGGDGSRIEAYRVYASFEDRNSDNGDQSASEVLIRDLTTSDFGVSDDGLPLVDVSLPSTEIVETFNLDPEAILAGDRLRVRTEVQADGQSWGSSNSSAAISNAYGGLLDLTVLYTCPLPSDFLVGDYTIELVDGRDSTDDGPSFNLEDVYTLSPVSGVSTRRSFDAVLLQDRDAGAIENTFTVDFTCDRTQLRTSDTGVSCGAQPIVYRSAGPGEFDITDDSSFTIPVDFFSVGNGDCGYEPTTATLLFTKV